MLCSTACWLLVVSARRDPPSGMRSPPEACLPGSPGPAASIAFRARSAAVTSCGRAAPGAGGRNSKSGGIVNGARDSTANSSGPVLSSPTNCRKPQPDSSVMEQSEATVSRKRPRRPKAPLSSVIVKDLPSPLLAARRGAAQQEAIQQHRRHPEANGAVGKIECRPIPCAHVKIKKINDRAEAQPANDVADRAADDEPDRNSKKQRAHAEQPDDERDHDERGKHRKDPKAERGLTGLVEKPKADAAIAGQHEIEERGDRHHTAGAAGLAEILQDPQFADLIEERREGCNSEAEREHLPGRRKRNAGPGAAVDDIGAALAEIVMARGVPDLGQDAPAALAEIAPGERCQNAD